MKNKKHEGLNLIREVFNFLIEDYSFREINSNASTLSWSIELVNRTTYLEIQFEHRDLGYYIKIGQLKGESVKPAETISLGEIVNLKSPEIRIFAYNSERYKDLLWKEYLELYAENLLKMASDLLRGNFTIWDKVLNNRDTNIY